MNRIYFPMTCNVLVPGHIKCVKKLRKKGLVIIGLLSSKALLGYKKEVIPFKDRLYILRELFKSDKKIIIVKQNSLNPERNIKKYRCNSIASGDGWEQKELESIKRLGIKKINIRSGEKVHSSDIYKK